MTDVVLPGLDGFGLLRQLQEIPDAQRAGFITEFLQKEVQGFLRLAQQDVPHGFRMLCQQGLVLEHVGMAIECVPCFLIAQVDSALDTAQCSIDL